VQIDRKVRHITSTDLRCALRGERQVLNKDNQLDQA